MPHVHSPLPYQDDVETIPRDEADDIQTVIRYLQAILKNTQRKTHEFRADVHVKTHGYAHAELRVLPNLPDELAQGLFEQEGAHEAVVRFSNASSQIQPDAVPDGRGMAIKVYDVTGETILVDGPRGPTQDFVMINHPVFFARNVKDYLRLEKIIATSEENVLDAAQQTITAGNWNPLYWHWHEMLTAAAIVGKLPTHPASQTYFTMSPIRFGNYVAKCRVKPIGDLQTTYLNLITKLATESDAMRLVLEETLRNQELLFEFQVQLRTSEKTMPIEDPTIEWPESESPYQTVGHLLLPRQDISPMREQTAFKNLAFNVWHALAAHRPLGGINRARRYAYQTSANWRRDQTTEQTS
ncbi:MAG: catalase family protein [Schlesneria sp.]